MISTYAPSFSIGMPSVRCLLLYWRYWYWEKLFVISTNWASKLNFKHTRQTACFFFISIEENQIQIIQQWFRLDLTLMFRWQSIIIIHLIKWNLNTKIRLSFFSSSSKQEANADIKTSFLNWNFCASLSENTHKENEIHFLTRWQEGMHIDVPLKRNEDLRCKCFILM